MPQDAPQVKLEATRGYGAQIVVYDKHTSVREELAARIAQERGLTVIPPYDHPQVVAGQGTAAKELFEDAGPLDFLLVCVGGGGLISGCALAADALSPGCRVIGVEPEAGDDATRSFKTGTLHKVHNPDTIADGARTPCLGEITFPLVLRYVDGHVSDQGLRSSRLHLGAHEDRDRTDRRSERRRAVRAQGEPAGRIARGRDHLGRQRRRARRLPLDRLNTPATDRRHVRAP